MPRLKNTRHERFAMALAEGRAINASFVIAGFVANNGNASTCAARPDIKARVAEIINEQVDMEKASIDLALQRLSITKERVLLELSNLGFANMKNYITVDDEGKPSIDLSSLTDGQMAAISSITVDEEILAAKPGKQAITTRKTTFKLYDKRGPLVDLGKHLGMFTEKVEHSLDQSLADLVLASFKKPPIT